MNAEKKSADYLGRFGELLATLYMMQKGYFVTQLGNANKQHDLFCEDENGKIISVQVKTANKNKPKGHRPEGFLFNLCQQSTEKSIYKSMSTSNIFIFICYLKESGNFYIYEYQGEYVRNKNVSNWWMHIDDLSAKNIFVSIKIPDFFDDSDEDFESQIPLLWDLVPLVQVNRSIEAA